MGSGKGKTRRVQAVATPLNPDMSASSEKSWDEFVASTGIKTTKLFRYYLGDDVVLPSDSQYEKLADEMFSDMVSVGVLVLPRPYEPSDFVFKMEKPSYYKQMVVRLKSKPDQDAQIVFNPTYSLNKNITMAGYGTSDTARRIHRAIVTQIGRASCRERV